MHHSSNKNKYEFPEGEKKFKGWRVDNETDYEVLIDVVLCRGTIVVTVKKVFD